MNIAKASEKDIDMALKLCGQLESIEQNFMPLAHDDDGDEDDSMFDRYDPHDCEKALNRVLNTLRLGSIGRVVFGMAVLCDPQNNLINPDSDILELHPDLSNRPKRQAEIMQWANATFGVDTSDVTGERIRRFLEEALELAQAIGLDQDDAQKLVEYVYARPAGDINQEIGQVGFSLLALAEHLHINAENEERKEFERITSLPPEHWQSRQNAKAEKGLALASTNNR